MSSRSTVHQISSQTLSGCCVVVMSPSAQNGMAHNFDQVLPTDSNDAVSLSHRNNRPNDYCRRQRMLVGALSPVKHRVSCTKDPRSVTVVVVAACLL